MKSGSASAEIDVTAWPAAREEQLGSKPKQWLARPGASDREPLWLWKQSTINIDSDEVEYRKGDDWAEWISSRVAQQLGVPAAQVELARRGDQLGVISRSMLSGDEVLVHGNELLADIGVEVDDTYERTGYTVEAVFRAVDGLEPPRAHATLHTAAEWFVGYLVLDAVIGNTDRHQENWAAIERERQRRLAPSFDHASSLGFLLSDDERVRRLDTRDANYAVDAWAARAPARFEGRPHPIDVARRGLLRVGQAQRAYWLDAVEGVPTLQPILRAVPPSRMSELARQFAARLFECNHRRLLSEGRSTMET